MKTKIIVQLSTTWLFLVTGMVCFLGIKGITLGVISLVLLVLIELAILDSRN